MAMSTATSTLTSGTVLVGLWAVGWSNVRGCLRRIKKPGIRGGDCWLTVCVVWVVGKGLEARAESG